MAFVEPASARRSSSGPVDDTACGKIFTVKQRVLFPLVSAPGGKATFAAPRFGRGCVCCNADAAGRTHDPDPRSGCLLGAGVQMPVCLACKDHAVQAATVPRLQAVLMMLGLLLLAVAAGYLTQRPHDGFLWGMLAVSGTAFVAGVLWIRATSRRDRREQIAGHHPRLEFSIAYGRTLLDTTNEELVREVLAHNPSARVLREPPLWRWQRRRQLPAARVVRSREP